MAGMEPGVPSAVGMLIFLFGFNPVITPGGIQKILIKPAGKFNLYEFLFHVYNIEYQLETGFPGTSRKADSYERFFDNHSFR